MAKKINEQTLAVLSQVTIENNVIFLPTIQLDRKLYVAVNEVLENIGGKWNKKAKGHVFSSDPTSALEQVMLCGEIVPPKNYGYFPTPPELAKKIVELADIKEGEMVLEPSAGQGGIADFVPKNCNLTCVEFLSDNCKVLQEKGYNVVEGDFLSLTGIPVCEKVVMNPPFSYEGHPQADIDHVMWAWNFLKSGGKLVAIMSAGFTFRENKKSKEFRDLVERSGYFERNPEGSFKESGTMVNTVIVVLNKE